MSTPCAAGRSSWSVGRCRRRVCSRTRVTRHRATVSPQPRLHPNGLLPQGPGWSRSRVRSRSGIARKADGTSAVRRSPRPAPRGERARARGDPVSQRPTAAAPVLGPVTYGGGLIEGGHGAEVVGPDQTPGTGHGDETGEPDGEKFREERRPSAISGQGQGSGCSVRRRRTPHETRGLGRALVRCLAFGGSPATGRRRVSRTRSPGAAFRWTPA